MSGDPGEAELEPDLTVLSAMRRRRLERDRIQRRANRRRRRSAVGLAVRRRWLDALDAYDEALEYALGLGADFNRTHRPEAIRDGDPLIDVLTRLHAKACRVAGEVRALLAAGFAAGAMARWRTLHEVAVTALFVEERGREVALRYWRHGDVEGANLAREYQAFAEAGAAEPIEPERMAEIEAQRAAAVATRGKAFGGQYGWAAAALASERPSFFDLEKAVGMATEARWRYRSASFAVHAQAWGLTFDHGAPPEGAMLAGPSDAGLAEPGQAALTSLLQATGALVGARPEDEWLVRLRVLERLVREAMEAFAAAEPTGSG